MEKDDSDFLDEIEKLIRYIEVSMPQEIMDNIDARVLLNTLKGILEDKKQDILLQYNNYDDALKNFDSDCEDSLYTEDLRIVSDARQLVKNTDNLVNKYTQTVATTAKFLQEFLKVWAQHEKGKSIDASEEEARKGEEAMQEIERLGNMPVPDVGINPFDSVIK